MGVGGEMMPNGKYKIMLLSVQTSVNPWLAVFILKKLLFNMLEKPDEKAKYGMAHCN